MISWETCKLDFQWDGSLRDIYIMPASLEDWRAIYPFLSDQTEVEFLTEAGASRMPDHIDESFFGASGPTLRFRVGGVLIVFHFFSPEAIECDLDPRELTGQDSLDALLEFMQQLGNLTHKRTVLTPENACDQPIFSYDPKKGHFQYHEAEA